MTSLKFYITISESEYLQNISEVKPLLQSPDFNIESEYRKEGVMDLQLHSEYQRFKLPLLTLILIMLPGIAAAHTEGAAGGGFLVGFMHPISGLDHVLAMIAVGLWGAVLGAPAVWVLPVAFPLIMTFGAVAGILGLPLPQVEMGIVSSVVLLGMVIALRFRPKLPLAVMIVSFFAVFHGYAYGTELPGNAGAVGFSIGFVLATGLLHMIGILAGLIHRFSWGERVLQGGGLAVSAAGIYLLTQMF